MNQHKKWSERHCFIFVYSLYWSLDPAKNAFEVAPFAYPHEEENSFPPNLPEDGNTKERDISQEKKKVINILETFF